MPPTPRLDGHARPPGPPPSGHLAAEVDALAAMLARAPHPTAGGTTAADRPDSLLLAQAGAGRPDTADLPSTVAL